MVITAINGSRVPWLYEQLKAKIYNRISKISNYLVVLMGGIVMLIALLAPEIMLIGTADYKEAVFVIPVVTLGVFFTFVYDMFASIEFYYGATKYVMAASVIGAVSNLILNAWLIPVFGYIAAAYTTLISYVLFMVMHLVFMKIVLKKQSIKEQVYNLKFIILFTVLLTGIVFLSLYTYHYPVMRYSLIASLLILVIVFRKKIVDMMSTMKKRK